MSNLISAALVFLISLVAIALVLEVGMPIVNLARETSEIHDADSDLHFIDTYVRAVAREGKDSVRIFRFTSPKQFESIPGEDAIQYSMETQTNFFDYLSRSFSGSFAYIAGSNVDCTEKDMDNDGVADLVMENDKIIAVFRKINGNIDTSDIIMKVTRKFDGSTAYVGNSSVVIDNNPFTSFGTGYTEISSNGLQKPVCRVHAVVRSTVDYDVYYTLYAGADFFVAEVIL
jgi:hypothetical protein